MIWAILRVIAIVILCVSLLGLGISLLGLGIQSGFNDVEYGWPVVGRLVSIIITIAAVVALALIGKFPR